MADDVTPGTTATATTTATTSPTATPTGPPRDVPGRAAGAARALEFWARSYRRTWRGSVVSGVLSPLLYLGALGIGLGTLVDDGASGGVGVRYALFVAPGVLAATAMQVAVGEATWPVMGAITWQRQYHAMLATPLGVLDILVGHLMFVVLRVLAVSAVFVAVGALLGAFTSWWALGAVLVATLCGAAYAAPVMAFTATQQNDHGFTMLFRFVVVPTFLFAGTFYPVDQLPAVIRPVAWVTPLWHATQACRDLALGDPQVAVVAAHCAYLALWVGGGVVAAAITFRRRLVR